MFQGRAQVSYKENVSKDTCLLGLNIPDIDPLPGQYVHVLCSADASQALLRRPFSIYDFRDRRLEILFRIRGTGTRALSRKEKGSYLDVMGPLGNGFRMSGKDGNFILMGGGIGVASLMFLARFLRRKRHASVHVLIGAKTRSEVLSRKRFCDLGCTVSVSTEDGTMGHRGKITGLLTSAISVPGVIDGIFACGPRAMLKEVSIISSSSGIPCQVSMEERIACGIGACRGCAIRVKKGKEGKEYLMVCKDGPVFDSRDIEWDPDEELR